MSKVLITGGAGYVGSLLVTALLNDGYKVRVFDTFWFWESVDSFLEETGLKGNKNLEVIEGDIRNRPKVAAAMWNIDYVINLACISNDPCSDLYYDFTHSVSYEGVMNVIEHALLARVKNFIHASSNSVYGLKEEEKVTEDLVPEPLTQYSKLKLEIEHYLLHLNKGRSFPCTILRPSTICGYSPRQRLDLTLNMFVDQAINNGEITIFGGDQCRPTLHIKDMVRIYQRVLTDNTINGQVYNCGEENGSVSFFASLVKECLPETKITTIDNPDHRSYRTCSEKLEKDLDFKYMYNSRDAIVEMIDAFKTGKLEDKKYYKNISIMKELLSNEN